MRCVCNGPGLVLLLKRRVTLKSMCWVGGGGVTEHVCSPEAEHSLSGTPGQIPSTT